MAGRKARLKELPGNWIHEGTEPGLGDKVKQPVDHPRPTQIELRADSKGDRGARPEAQTSDSLGDF